MGVMLTRQYGFDYYDNHKRVYICTYYNLLRFELALSVAVLIFSDTSILTKSILLLLIKHANCVTAQKNTCYHTLWKNAQNIYGLISIQETHAEPTNLQSFSRNQY